MGGRVHSCSVVPSVVRGEHVRLVQANGEDVLLFAFTIDGENDAEIRVGGSEVHALHGEFFFVQNAVHFAHMESTLWPVTS